jgi:hypothetical protein
MVAVLQVLLVELEVQEAEVLLVELEVQELLDKAMLAEAHLLLLTQQVAVVVVQEELVNQVVVLPMELAQMVALELRLALQVHL